MKVVLDTNILISRALSPSGRAAQIFRFFQKDAFEPVVTGEILAEYRRALNYEEVRSRHKLSLEEIEAILRLFAPFEVVAEPITPVCRDPDDDRFLAAAVAAGAQYIVSGDDDLLGLKEYQGIRIVTPAVFLALLEAEGGEERL